MTDSSPRALVLLAVGAEEMELTIIVDVLRRGGVTVVLSGIAGPEPVRCSRGVTLVPDAGLESVVGEFDIVVLPGGLGGTEQLAASKLVGDLLRRQRSSGGEIAAICAAPMALARHGIAQGLAMTCHPSVADEVGKHGVLTEGRVVRAPGLTTSMGPGTAFEFALALVARLQGDEAATEVRSPMILD